MLARILIINPNASESMTVAIAHSAELVPPHADTRIAVLTNHAGPRGIETDADVAAVVPQLRAMVASEAAEIHVIACFSDPGVDVLRAATRQRIIGIGEAAYRAALERGARFGIVSIVQASIARHRARLQALGLTDRLAGDRAIDIGVADLGGDDVAPRLLAVGRALRQDGADSIVLGCAGLGGYRDALQKALGMPVIDPVQAAVTAAVAMLSADTGASPDPEMRGHVPA